MIPPRHNAEGPTVEKGTESKPGLRQNGISYKQALSNVSAEVPTLQPSSCSDMLSHGIGNQSVVDNNGRTKSRRKLETQQKLPPEFDKLLKETSKRIRQQKYPSLRNQALEDAKDGHYDLLKGLFMFWSLCLQIDFDTNMYEDFKAQAKIYAELDFWFGMERLFWFYCYATTCKQLEGLHQEFFEDFQDSVIFELRRGNGRNSGLKKLTMQVKFIPQPLPLRPELVTLVGQTSVDVSSRKLRREKPALERTSADAGVPPNQPNGPLSHAITESGIIPTPKPDSSPKAPLSLTVKVAPEVASSDMSSAIARPRTSPEGIILSPVESQLVSPPSRTNITRNKRSLTSPSSPAVLDSPDSDRTTSLPQEPGILSTGEKISATSQEKPPRPSRPLENWSTIVQSNLAKAAAKEANGVTLAEGAASPKPGSGDGDVSLQTEGQDTRRLQSNQNVSELASGASSPKQSLDYRVGSAGESNNDIPTSTKTPPLGLNRSTPFSQPTPRLSPGRGKRNTSPSLPTMPSTVRHPSPSSRPPSLPQPHSTKSLGSGSAVGSGPDANPSTAFKSKSAKSVPSKETPPLRNQGHKDTRAPRNNVHKFGPDGGRRITRPKGDSRGVVLNHLAEGIVDLPAIDIVSPEPIYPHLHTCVMEYAHWLRNAVNMEQRDEAIRRLRNAVSEVWDTASAHVYGSLATGLALPDSDVDVVVCGYGIDDYSSRAPQRAVVNSLRRLACVLSSKPWVYSLTCMERTAFPVIIVQANLNAPAAFPPKHPLPQSNHSSSVHSHSPVPSRQHRSAPTSPIHAPFTSPSPPTGVVRMPNSSNSNPVVNPGAILRGDSRSEDGQGVPTQDTCLSPLRKCPVPTPSTGNPAGFCDGRIPSPAVSGSEGPTLPRRPINNASGDKDTECTSFEVTHQSPEPSIASPASGGMLNKTNESGEDRPRCIRLDISFYSQKHSGLGTVETVRNLLHLYWPVRELVLVIKQHLLERGLNNPYTGGITSYCLLILVTRYYQEFTAKSVEVPPPLPYDPHMQFAYPTHQMLGPPSPARSTPHTTPPLTPHNTTSPSMFPQQVPLPLSGAFPVQAGSSLLGGLPSSSLRGTLEDMDSITSACGQASPATFTPGSGAGQVRYTPPSTPPRVSLPMGALPAESNAAWLNGGDPSSLLGSQPLPSAASPALQGPGALGATAGLPTGPHPPTTLIQTASGSPHVTSVPTPNMAISLTGAKEPRPPSFAVQAGTGAPVSSTDSPILSEASFVPTGHSAGLVCEVEPGNSSSPSFDYPQTLPPGATPGSSCRSMMPPFSMNMPHPVTWATAVPVTAPPPPVGLMLSPGALRPPLPSGPGGPTPPLTDIVQTHPKPPFRNSPEQTSLPSPQAASPYQKLPAFNHPMHTMPNIANTHRSFMPPSTPHGAYAPLPVAYAAVPYDMGQLLVGFFRFYSRFDFKALGISVVGQGAFLDRNHEAYEPHRYDHLFVQDPVDTENNVGRNCFRIAEIQRCFAEAYADLTQNANTTFFQHPDVHSSEFTL
eukprot:Rmarinus@m.10669